MYNFCEVIAYIRQDAHPSDEAVATDQLLQIARTGTKSGVELYNWCGTIRSPLDMFNFEVILQLLVIPVISYFDVCVNILYAFSIHNLRNDQNFNIYFVVPVENYPCVYLQRKNGNHTRENLMYFDKRYQVLYFYSSATMDNPNAFLCSR